MRSPDAVWQPPGDWRQTTLLGELCARLGVQGYEALQHAALADPAAYWSTVMAHLDFRWRVRYSEFCATDDGPAFPRWFSGGRLNWVDGVFRHADTERANAPALIAEEESGAVETLSYAQLRQRTLQLAGGLARLGVARGSRVGLMMPMGAPAVLTLLAIATLGAIAVPLFSGFGAEAACARLELAQAGFLVAGTGFRRRGREVDTRETLQAIRTRIPGLKLVLDGSATDGLPDAAPWRSIASAAPLPEAIGLAAHDPFMIVFTSGTTGRPKGTVHTHSGFPLKILHDSAYHFELRPGDRWFWPSDMGWIVGPITSVGALLRGAALVCYDGAPDFPAASRIADIVDRHRVTHFGASPTLLRSLAASGEAVAGARLDSLRLLITAGEVIDPEHFAWFFETFGDGRLPVINYTGGTEASGALLANVPVRPIKPCGFNTASPGVDAFVGDAEGGRIAEGVGELVVKAPFIGMTDGFWGAPDQYLESYWSQRPGLWSHGDLVAVDADGHFFVLGRADDTLKIAGKRVGPAEVEALLLELPQVREAAAVGLPDTIKGQRLVVCLVAEPAAASGLAELAARRIEGALGKPFRPAAVHLVNELPRTRNGKLLRRVVRNVYLGLPPGDLSALENPSAIEALQRAANGA
jgi:acetyl-CoA synthetase